MHVEPIKLIEINTSKLKKDGGFTDPLSGEQIIIDRSETYLVTGDVRDDGSSYKYLINLANEIDFTKIHGNAHQG